MSESNRGAVHALHVECPAREDDGTEHEGYTNDTKTLSLW